MLRRTQQNLNFKHDDIDWNFTPTSERRKSPRNVIEEILDPRPSSKPVAKPQSVSSSRPKPIEPGVVESVQSSHPKPIAEHVSSLHPGPAAEPAVPPSQTESAKSSSSKSAVSAESTLIDPMPLPLIVDKTTPAVKPRCSKEPSTDQTEWFTDDFDQYDPNDIKSSLTHAEECKQVIDVATISDKSTFLQHVIDKSPDNSVFIFYKLLIELEFPSNIDSAFASLAFDDCLACFQSLDSVYKKIERINLDYLFNPPLVDKKYKMPDISEARIKCLKAIFIKFALFAWCSNLSSDQDVQKYLKSCSASLTDATKWCTIQNRRFDMILSLILSTRICQFDAFFEDQSFSLKEPIEKPKQIVAIIKNKFEKMKRLCPEFKKDEAMALIEANEKSIELFYDLSAQSNTIMKELNGTNFLTLFENHKDILQKKKIPLKFKYVKPEEKEDSNYTIRMKYIGDLFEQIQKATDEKRPFVCFFYTNLQSFSKKTTSFKFDPSNAADYTKQNDFQTDLWLLQTQIDGFTFFPFPIDKSSTHWHTPEISEVQKNLHLKQYECQTYFLQLIFFYIESVFKTFDFTEHFFFTITEYDNFKRRSNGNIETIVKNFNEYITKYSKVSALPFDAEAFQSLTNEKDINKWISPAVFFCFKFQTFFNFLIDNNLIDNHIKQRKYIETCLNICKKGKLFALKNLDFIDKVDNTFLVVQRYKQTFETVKHDISVYKQMIQTLPNNVQQLNQPHVKLSDTIIAKELLEFKSEHFKCKENENQIYDLFDMNSTFLKLFYPFLTLKHDALQNIKQKYLKNEFVFPSIDPSITGSFLFNQNDSIRVERHGSFSSTQELFYDCVVFTLKLLDIKNDDQQLTAFIYNKNPYVEDCRKAIQEAFQKQNHTLPPLRFEFFDYFIEAIKLARQKQEEFKQKFLQNVNVFTTALANIPDTNKQFKDEATAFVNSLVKNMSRYTQPNIVFHFVPTFLKNVTKYKEITGKQLQIT